MIVSVPLFVVAGFLLIAASPTLATLVGVFISRRVGQYAIVRPCREMLYTTVDRESKYKAKNVNDTLVYRTSDFVVAKGHDAIVSAFSASLSGIASWARGSRRCGRSSRSCSVARTSAWPVPKLVEGIEGDAPLQCEARRNVEADGG